MNTNTKILVTAIIAVAVLSAITAGSFFTAGSNPSSIETVRLAHSQQSAGLSDAAPSTIRVTGDASTSLVPDHATIIISSQAKPGMLDSVLSEQADKIEEIMQAVRTAGGDSQVSIGAQNLYPYYTGSGVRPSNNVTFAIYASVRIDTNIDQLSSLVNKLAEEGFGFESVYIDPIYSPAVLREGGIASSVGSDGGNSSGAGENPIAIAVSINTQPALLTEAISEYEEKYRSLLAILDELGVSQAQVHQSSFNVNPLFYGPAQGSGYSASTQVIVRTGIENIATISTALQDISNAYVENVLISVSDETIDKARGELSQEAIANARARAEEIAGPLGLTVKGIKSIESGTSEQPNPYGGEFAYRGVKVFQPYYYQNLVGGISVSVTVEFELGQTAAG